MPCKEATSYTFAVYDIWPDGTECDTGKIFSITIEENRRIMEKFGYGSGGGIDDYGILLVMFDKLFGFTIGPNGFVLKWDRDELDVPKRYVSGKLHWGGPRLPAAQIGGFWWGIKRVA